VWVRFSSINRGVFNAIIGHGACLLVLLLLVFDETASGTNTGIHFGETTNNWYMVCLLQCVDDR